MPIGLPISQNAKPTYILSVQKNSVHSPPVARRVPAKPARNFHEAMQCICFFHIALHASMNFISLGRLDQVLQPYLEKETDKAKALEDIRMFHSQMRRTLKPNLQIPNQTRPRRLCHRVGYPSLLHRPEGRRQQLLAKHYRRRQKGPTVQTQPTKQPISSSKPSKTSICLHPASMYAFIKRAPTV